MYGNRVSTLCNGLMFFALCLVLVACDSNSGGGNRLPSNTPTADIDPARISMADTSAMQAAIANGVDPYSEIISANFFCYLGNQIDFNTPLVSVSVSGNTMTSFSNGETFVDQIITDVDAGTIVIVDGEGSSSNVFLDMSDYGQILRFSSTDAICFQEGAALNYAFAQYTANVPEQGAFECRSASFQTGAVTLELIDGNFYRINAATGQYTYSNFGLEGYSDLEFVSGPLAGSAGQYYEDVDNGIQTMSVSDVSSTAIFLNTTSTSSLALSCQRQREPRPFKLYSTLMADAVPPPQVPLSGLYIIDVSESTLEEFSNRVVYLQFWSSGHFRGGIPLPGGTDCTRTRPSGLPICNGYAFDGTTVMTLGSSDPEEQSQVVRDANGVITLFDFLPTDLVTPVDPAAILGSWFNFESSAGDFTLCLLGYCSSSLSETTLSFRADGRFLYRSSSESSSSAVTESVGTFSSGSSVESGSGSYALFGQNIVLTSDQGGSFDIPLTFTRSGKLALGELLYTRLE